MQVVSTLQVGTKERLLLVKAGEKFLLVGATAQSLSILHVFDQAEESWETFLEKRAKGFSGAPVFTKNEMT